MDNEWINILKKNNQLQQGLIDLRDEFALPAGHLRPEEVNQEMAQLQNNLND